jgi:hypothetical protein
MTKPPEELPFHRQWGRGVGKPFRIFIGLLTMAFYNYVINR